MKAHSVRKTERNLDFDRITPTPAARSTVHSLHVVDAAISSPDTGWARPDQRRHQPPDVATTLLADRSPDLLSAQLGLNVRKSDRF
jgi:hypothetical protein